ncbi:hypothetical protein F4804DRAFT_31734 [Jackrogersella minutella]|nr:hypothetical protein F4804DRAFT_31734 [Jackrogersella minutella]
MDDQAKDQHKLVPVTASDTATTKAVPSDEKRDASTEPKHGTSDTETQVNDAVDDIANDDKLSSPPDTNSEVSSINPDVLGDEIVVGTRANGNKSPARRISSSQEDAVMANAQDDQPVSHYPKRKRNSLHSDLNENKIDSSLAKDNYETDASKTTTASVPKGKGRQRIDDDNKHVPIGYWRDSPVPNEGGKHTVVGFIDIRDRLRTRIRNIDLNGEHINTRLFPIPPGPGGSWVTFERIVFLDHLIGHDHNVIKEYVKVRADSLKNRSGEADVEAIQEAQRNLRDHPPAETAQPLSIAWGRELPDHPLGSRAEPKRRRYGSAVGTIAERHELTERPERAEQAGPSELAEGYEAAPPEPQPQSEFPVPPRKPTRIIVGVWSKSAPVELEEKHAVFGILGANDMFRVKLVKETKDGRFIPGGFPSGAGALWIPYDEVIFLEHLKDLSRPEIKEYVRIRQTQIDAGETEEEQVSNETKAVHEAQIRAMAIAAVSRTPSQTQPPSPAQAGSLPSRGGREDIRENHELRQSRREVASRNVEAVQPPRHPHQEADAQQAGRPASNDPIERLQGYANREVARMEAVQLRTSLPQATHSAGPTPLASPSLQDTRRDFQDNVQRMNHVWRAQETMRMHPLDIPYGRMYANRPSIPPPNEVSNVMTHQGVRYERKQTGPFKDRLVSQGTIINIDGEDYVEYRVLTKPSFF